MMSCGQQRGVKVIHSQGKLAENMSLSSLCLLASWWPGYRKSAGTVIIKFGYIYTYTYMYIDITIISMQWYQSTLCLQNDVQQTQCGLPGITVLPPANASFGVDFVKRIKNSCPCIVEIRGMQGCVLVGDPARAVGECRDVAKVQP